jgi:hypothetical protein
VQTLPSLKALVALFDSAPRVGAEHPEYGILKYDIEFESEHERLSLSVLPLAEEVNVDLFTKSPPRFVRLSLQDVSELIVLEEEDEKRLEVRFHNSEVQTLSLRLRPVFMLLWGNYQDSPERHPSWERD